MNQRIVGIDPGNEVCGLCVLDEGQITGAFNLNHADLWGKVTNFLLVRSPIVVIEDIRPYSLPLTPQIIATCKWIGEAVYRLQNEAGVDCRLVPRASVKKWVFDSFPETVRSGIEKKIEKKGQITKTGRQREPSFHYIDDSLVIKAMKELYGIEQPKAGSGYAHGLIKHSWQALAVATYVAKTM